MANANAASAKVAAATLAEMRSDRVERQAPRVLVYFSSPDSHLGHLVIENIGESTATDVEIAFDPPLVSSIKASESEFLETPKVLPPRFRMTHLFDSWIDYFAKQRPDRYTVRLRYRQAGAPVAIEETQIVDVGGFKHFRYARSIGLPEIVRELEQLRRLVERFATETTAESVARTTQAELLGQFRNPKDAVTAARRLWTLMRSMDEASWVHPDRRGFHLAIRTLIAGAIVHAETGTGSAKLVPALRVLYSGFSDYRLRCIGDQSEVVEAIEKAFAEIDSMIDGPSGERGLAA